MNIKHLIKGALPPIVLDTLRRLAHTERAEPIRFAGDYQSWDEAEHAADGYAAPQILAKTRAALLEVRDGKAAFERDSMLFAVMEHEFSLLAGLLRGALAGNGKLHVLDFGGSLGNNYFRCRNFLSVVTDFRWNVVEQAEHVACGQAEFANDQLFFYPTIDECLSAEQPNVLLFLSVVQYLREPYALLREALRREIPYVVVERTPFTLSGRDRLTVQYVPAWLYKASYPAWFLSEPAFLRLFEDRYDLICEYVVDENLHPEGEQAIYKGFHFQLKN
jgi:putative methyltransferase (TIGR04325 family)